MPDTVLGGGATAVSWSVPALMELTSYRPRRTRKKQVNYHFNSGTWLRRVSSLSRFHLGFMFRSIIDKNLCCHTGVQCPASPPKSQLSQPHLGKSGSFSRVPRPFLCHRCPSPVSVCLWVCGWALPSGPFSCVPPLHHSQAAVCWVLSSSWLFPQLSVLTIRGPLALCMQNS